jgi:hypothetical protein
MALELVLRLSQEFCVSQIQIIGDSLLVIQWMHKEIVLRNFTLQPLYDDVHILITTVSHISLSHIYRDMNRKTNGLSKHELGLNK